MDAIYSPENGVEVMPISLPAALLMIGSIKAEEYVLPPNLIEHIKDLMPYSTSKMQAKITDTLVSISIFQRELSHFSGQEQRMITSKDYGDFNRSCLRVFGQPWNQVSRTFTARLIDHDEYQGDTRERLDLDAPARGTLFIARENSYEELKKTYSIVGIDNEWSDSAAPQRLFEKLSPLFDWHSTLWDYINDKKDAERPTPLAKSSAQLSELMIQADRHNMSFSSYIDMVIELSKRGRFMPPTTAAAPLPPYKLLNRNVWPHDPVTGNPLEVSLRDYLYWSPARFVRVFGEPYPLSERYEASSISGQYAFLSEADPTEMWTVYDMDVTGELSNGQHGPTPEQFWHGGLPRSLHIASTKGADKDLFVTWLIDKLDR